MNAAPKLQLGVLFTDPTWAGFETNMKLLFASLCEYTALHPARAISQVRLRTVTYPRATPGGLVVIDFDPRHGRSWMKPDYGKVSDSVRRRTHKRKSSSRESWKTWRQEMVKLVGYESGMGMAYDPLLYKWKFRFLLLE
jgi:hypothetical protein